MTFARFPRPHARERTHLVQEWRVIRRVPRAGTRAHGDGSEGALMGSDRGLPPAGSISSRTGWRCLAGASHPHESVDGETGRSPWPHGLHRLGRGPSVQPFFNQAAGRLGLCSRASGEHAARAGGTAGGGAEFTIRMADQGCPGLSGTLWRAIQGSAIPFLSRRRSARGNKVVVAKTARRAQRLQAGGIDSSCRCESRGCRGIQSAPAKGSPPTSTLRCRVGPSRKP